MIRERNLAEQTEHQPDGEFCDAGCGSAWGRENCGSLLFRSLKVNIVEADPGASDDHEFRVSNQTSVDFCSASNYQHIIIINDAGKLRLVYPGLIVYCEACVRENPDALLINRVRNQYSQSTQSTLRNGR